jgi:hypothetical protein
LIDIADSLRKQLAAKLLFEIVTPGDLQTSEGLCDAQLGDKMRLLTVMLHHYTKSSAELQRNYSVGAIWECRFKPHIAKQLTLNKL